MQDRMVFITYWDNVAAELRKQMPQCSVELLVDNGSVIVNDQGFEGLLEKLNPDNLAYSPNYRTFDTDQIAELAKGEFLPIRGRTERPGNLRALTPPTDIRLRRTTRFGLRNWKTKLPFPNAR